VITRKPKNEMMVLHHILKGIGVKDITIKLDIWVSYNNNIILKEVKVVSRVLNILFNSEEFMPIYRKYKHILGP
jgi:hypothetical protein